MRQSFKFAAALMVAALAAVACDKSSTDPASSAKEEALRKVNEAFVDNTVIPTYKNLADKSLELQAAIEKLQANPTDANVKAACDLWKSARQYWEWSEAFLFGAASKYYIDPHIDTWPLDKVALENLLDSDKMMADIENTVANLNNGLVGFHGIEYIIFRDGNERAASAIPAKELLYAAAVAKDLSLSAARLEAAWAGLDNVSAVKKEMIEDAEMEPADDFGEQMKLSGQAGSVWKSVTAGSEQILEGCKDIVDEVGSQKIGKPYTGEDVNYIESPHSWNSIEDFYDNIVSVRNAYFGALGATAAQTYSVSAYLAGVDKAADDGVKAAVSTCLEKISAMPKPFVKNYKDAKVKDAIDACNALNDALEAARQALIND